MDKQAIIDLYKKAATDLPADIREALEDAYKRESSQTGREVLEKILENIKLAKKEERPICQDTGTPFFYIKYQPGISTRMIEKIIQEATIEATESIPLRPNAVGTLTGKNQGNQPVFHFKEAEKEEISLMLKGGGSENVSTVYRLPDKDLRATRDLKGVAKCVIDAIFKAQGRGCPPYIIGVGIGGNIEEVAGIAKRQLLRSLNDTNKIEVLNGLENEILNKVNSLGIGPLGLGGDTTALGVKIGIADRHPATYFVGVAISCWALRRAIL